MTNIPLSKLKERNTTDKVDSGFSSEDDIPLIDICLLILHILRDFNQFFAFENVENQQANADPTETDGYTDS